MKFRLEKDFDTHESRFAGSVTVEDIQNMELSDFDKLLLRDCERPDGTAD